MSVTDVYNCTHGPKKDCHACLIPEMAEVLETLIDAITRPAVEGLQYFFERMVGELPRARAVLEKAKLIEDCIPIEEAEEASRT